MDNAAWKDWIGATVVVDTNSIFVYIGKLQEVLPDFLVMVEVDVHDRNDGQSTKERYVMDSKLHGVRANRKTVSVRKDLVVSVSRIEDILEY